MSNENDYVTLQGRQIPLERDEFPSRPSNWIPGIRESNSWSAKGQAWLAIESWTTFSGRRIESNCFPNQSFRTVGLSSL